MDSTEQDARLYGAVTNRQVEHRKKLNGHDFWEYWTGSEWCLLPDMNSGSVVFGDDDNSGLVGRMRGMGWHILPGPGPDGQYQATAIRDVPKPKDETHRVTAPTPVAAAIAAMKAALRIAEAQG